MEFLAFVGQLLGFFVGEVVHLVCTPYLFAAFAGLSWIGFRTVSGKWFAPKVAS